MADVFTEEKRSEIMSRIRSTGTKPEETLYELVRSILGHRWRIDRNSPSLPGKPDVVIPSLRVALFADGCFYHCCPKHGGVPKSNIEYWEAKLKRNAQRDRAHTRSLRTQGFSVWRVWEHDLKPTTLPHTRRLLERRLARTRAGKSSTPSTSPRL